MLPPLFQKPFTKAMIILLPAYCGAGGWCRPSDVANGVTAIRVSAIGAIVIGVGFGAMGVGAIGVAGVCVVGVNAIGADEIGVDAVAHHVRL
jgi:hypothetical protein